MNLTVLKWWNIHRGDELLLKPLWAEDRQGLRSLTRLSLISIFFPYIYSSLHEYQKITLLVYLTLYNKTRYSIFFFNAGPSASIY